MGTKMRCTGRAPGGPWGEIWGAGLVVATAPSLLSRPRGIGLVGTHAPCGLLFMTCRIVFV